MSEELIQRNLVDSPEKMGDWNFYNIGATTLKALKSAKIIPDHDYDEYEKKKPPLTHTLEQELTLFIDCSILDAHLSESLATLQTSGALTTMVLTTLVTAPGLTVINAQSLTPSGYVCFGHERIGRA